MSFCSFRFHIYQNLESNFFVGCYRKKYFQKYFAKVYFILFREATKWLLRNRNLFLKLIFLTHQKVAMASGRTFFAANTVCTFYSIRTICKFIIHKNNWNKIHNSLGLSDPYRFKELDIILKSQLLGFLSN